ncbi:MAG: GTP cyclohydrolase II [Myxococcota bacterium]
MTTISSDLEPTSGTNPSLRDGLPEVGERICENDVWVEVYARAHMPSRFGNYEIFVFRNNVDDKEHVAMVRGDIRDQERVPMRIHSECLTGDVMGSLKCDCRDQLEYALRTFGNSETGLLLYMRQEGRGIGLGNKIRAYALQDAGLDTVDANRHLGFDDDLRDYTVAALMTKILGPASVQLYTNNPRKIFGLKQRGVEVETRLPIVMPSNEYNRDYLSTKATRSGHIIPIDSTDS